MVSTRNGILITLLSLLHLFQFSYAQIYNAEPYFPTLTKLQVCSQEDIAELEAFAAAETCRPEQNYTKEMKLVVYADGCAVSACQRCNPFDIHIGGGQCFKPKFHAVVTVDNPEPQFCAGNPINVINGKKIQQEVDIHPIREGQAEFYRTYSNSDPSLGGHWYNNYQKYMRFIGPNSNAYLRAKASGYSSREDACINGFNEIKNQINDAWTQGTVASYSEGRCSILRGSGQVKQLIKTIQIVADGSEYPNKAVAHGIQLVREDGSLLEFSIDSHLRYRSFQEEVGNLTYINNGNPTAWRYVNQIGEVEEYNKDGRLIFITSKTGLKKELFYDQVTGFLTRVKDSTSRELVFEYTDNKISSVTIGGSITTRYTYNSLGLIESVTRPDDTIRTYHYEDGRFPSYLTGITDERGVRYATWTYNSNGLAVTSEHAGGAEETQLSFNVGSTIVTNSLGGQTNYQIQNIEGRKLVTKATVVPTANVEGGDKLYTYIDGRLGCVTDAKGVRKCYGYDMNGRMYFANEAWGQPEYKTMSIDWHPNLNVITNVVKSGRRTSFTYDDRGRLLTQTIKSEGQ